MENYLVTHNTKKNTLMDFSYLSNQKVIFFSIDSCTSIEVQNKK